MTLLRKFFIFFSSTIRRPPLPPPISLSSGFRSVPLLTSLALPGSGNRRDYPRRMTRDRGLSRMLMYRNRKSIDRRLLSNIVKQPEQWRLVNGYLTTTKKLVGLRFSYPGVRPRHFPYLAIEAGVSQSPCFSSVGTTDTTRYGFPSISFFSGVGR